MVLGLIRFWTAASKWRSKDVPGDIQEFVKPIYVAWKRRFSIQAQLWAEVRLNLPMVSEPLMRGAGRLTITPLILVLIVGVTDPLCGTMGLKVGQKRKRQKKQR